MSNRPEPLDRATAERLLRGEAAAVDSATDPLAATLAAAAAPPRGAELAGEEAALAAFREARLAPSPASRPRPSAIRSARARFLTFRAGLVALAATATAAGSVALAAGTGHLPGQQHTTGPGGTRPRHGGHHTAGSPHPGRTPLPGGGVQPSGGTTAAAPAPDLAGLCTAYNAIATGPQAGAPGRSGKAPKSKAVEKAVKKAQAKALQSPAFADLVNAAGGSDKVAAFCAQVAKAHPGTPRPSWPSNNPPAGLPTDRPKGNGHTKLPKQMPTPHMSMPAGGRGH